MTSNVIDLLDSDEEQEQQQKQPLPPPLPKPPLLTKKSSTLSALSTVSSSKFWDIENEDPIESTQAHPSFSTRTIELLASLDKERGDVKALRKSAEPSSKTIAVVKRKASSLGLEEIVSSDEEVTKKATKSSKKLTDEEKAAKALERETKKADKEKEKDLEKEKKRLAKVRWS